MSVEVIVRGGATGFEQRVEVGEHALVADEPAALGGDDAGPDPYGLLVAALGACTSMTVAMYARRKGWPLLGVTVRLRHGKVHAEDCVDCEDPRSLLDRVELVLDLHGELSDDERARLLEIARRCPVHRTLTAPTRIDATLAPRAAEEP